MKIFEHEGDYGGDWPVQCSEEVGRTWSMYYLKLLDRVDGIFLFWVILENVGALYGSRTASVDISTGSSLIICNIYENLRDYDWYEAERALRARARVQRHVSDENPDTRHFHSWYTYEKKINSYNYPPIHYLHS